MHQVDQPWLLAGIERMMITSTKGQGHDFHKWPKWRTISSPLLTGLDTYPLNYFPHRHSLFLCVCPIHWESPSQTVVFLEEVKRQKDPTHLPHLIRFSVVVRRLYTMILPDRLDWKETNYYCRKRRSFQVAITTGTIPTKRVVEEEKRALKDETESINVQLIFLINFSLNWLRNFVSI